MKSVGLKIQNMSYIIVWSSILSGLFRVKGENQDLIDGVSIYLLDDSVKTLVHQVSVKEGTLETDEPTLLDDEEFLELEEEWTLF